VNLGLSFLYVWNRHRNSHSRIRGMAGCLCVILFALTITHFAKIEAFRTEFNNAVNNAVYNVDDNPDYNPTANSFTIPYLVIQLSVAFDIMLWVDPWQSLHSLSILKSFLDKRLGCEM
jgi:hypothetical protein